MIRERIYHEGIREPLRWIVLAVFQPARFRAACEPTGFRQRAGMQARLIVPLFLLSLLLVTLVRIIPLPAHLLVWSNEPHVLPWSPWLVSAIGVTFGLVMGLLFGAIWGVSFGIDFSLTAGVVFGLPGVYALLRTDALGAWLVPALGLAAGLALGLSFGLPFGLALNVQGSIVARLAISLLIGLILGVIGGLTAGLPGGLASGLAAGVGSILGLARGSRPWFTRQEP